MKKKNKSLKILKRIQGYSYELETLNQEELKVWTRYRLAKKEHVPASAWNMLKGRL